jgi:hypothetical protein
MTMEDMYKQESQWKQQLGNAQCSTQASTIGGIQTPRESPITQALNNLERDLNVMQEVAHGLAGRLNPILSPPTPCEADKEYPGSGVPMVTAIAEVDKRVRQTTALLRDLIERVAL